MGQLDMRTGVGHLTRNIKISGNVESTGWGCRVLIYSFNETGAPIESRGYATLNGVEWINCGQFDSTKAALDFR